MTSSKFILMPARLLGDVMIECRHGLEDCPCCMQETIDALMTALRRIRSLDEKNVPKYAQQIASEALQEGGGK